MRECLGRRTSASPSRDGKGGTTTSWVGCEGSGRWRSGVGVRGPRLPAPHHAAPPAQGPQECGSRAASPSGPRGGAVACRRPGALRGRGWGRRGGRREGGGKSRVLPLAASSLAAAGGGRGSGGNARPGDRIPRPPLRPTRLGPWTPGGGLGERRAHVTEPLGHVTAAAGHGGAGWGSSCQAAGRPAGPGAGRERGRGVDSCSWRGSGSVGRRRWELWRSRILEGGLGGGAPPVAGAAGER